MSKKHKNNPNVTGIFSSDIPNLAQDEETGTTIQRLESLYGSKGIPSFHIKLFVSIARRLEKSRCIEEVQKEINNVESETARILEVLKTIEARENCIKRLLQESSPDSFETCVQHIRVLTILSVEAVTKWEEQLNRMALSTFEYCNDPETRPVYHHFSFIYKGRDYLEYVLNGSPKDEDIFSLAKKWDKVFRIFRGDPLFLESNKRVEKFKRIPIPASFRARSQKALLKLIDAAARQEEAQAKGVDLNQIKLPIPRHTPGASRSIRIKSTAKKLVVSQNKIQENPKRTKPFEAQEPASSPAKLKLNENEPENKKSKEELRSSKVPEEKLPKEEISPIKEEERHPLKPPQIPVEFSLFHGNEEELFKMLKGYLDELRGFFTCCYPATPKEIFEAAEKTKNPRYFMAFEAKNPSKVLGLACFGAMNTMFFGRRMMMHHFSVLSVDFAGEMLKKSVEFILKNDSCNEVFTNLKTRENEEGVQTTEDQMKEILKAGSFKWKSLNHLGKFSSYGLKREQFPGENEMGKDIETQVQNLKVNCLSLLSLEEKEWDDEDDEENANERKSKRSLDCRVTELAVLAAYLKSKPEIKEQAQIEGGEFSENQLRVVKNEEESDFKGITCQEITKRNLEETKQSELKDIPVPDDILEVKNEEKKKIFMGKVQTEVSFKEYSVHQHEGREYFRFRNVK